MKKPRVLVTGSSGFVGARLCPHLAEHGCSVVGLDIHETTSPRPGVESHRWNSIDDLPTDGPFDAIILLAQSPGYRDFPNSASDLWTANVLGVAKIIESFHQSRPWIFLASTGSVYEPSFAPLSESAPLRRNDAYAASKLAAEDLIRLYPGPALIGRFFTIFGPGQQGRLVPSIIERVRRGDPVTVAAGPMDPEDATGGLRISMALVDDVVRLLSALVDRAVTGDPVTGTLNLAPPTATSIREVAEAAAQTVDRAAIIEEAATPRTGDLVADTSKLEATMTSEWTPLRDAVAVTAAPFAADGVS